MLVDEPVVESWLPAGEALVLYGVPVVGALAVILAGHGIAACSPRSRGRHVIDLDGSDQARPRRGK